jgi:hypothetical protein
MKLSVRHWWHASRSTRTMEYQYDKQCLAACTSRPVMAALLERWGGPLMMFTCLKRATHHTTADDGFPPRHVCMSTVYHMHVTRVLMRPSRIVTRVYFVAACGIWSLEGHAPSEALEALACRRSHYRNLAALPTPLA